MEVYSDVLEPLKLFWLTGRDWAPLECQSWGPLRVEYQCSWNAITHDMKSERRTREDLELHREPSNQIGSMETVPNAWFTSTCHVHTYDKHGD